MQDRSIVVSLLVIACAASGFAPAAVRASPSDEPSAEADPMATWASLFAPAADAAPPAPPLDAPGDLAYNKDFWNGRFGFHALNNFPGFTSVANIGGNIFATDFDPTATTLYALSTDTLQLGTFNLATGAFTAIGPSVPSVAGHNNWSGLAIDPVSGLFYASAIAGAANMPYGLYTIDPTTGAATLIGQDAASMGMIAIAMSCTGELYGHDIISDSIYQIDPANGALTLVGPTGAAANFAQGMDFDNTTGELYAWVYTGGGTNVYGTINLATGAITPLSTSNPIGEYEGAIQNACLIFADGFESSDTSAWSVTVP